MKKFIYKNVGAGLLFSLGFFGGIILLVKAAGLTATTGEPLTVSKWTDMAANFFWGSGSGGIFYNGKVGIGTSSPNKSLHIKTSAGTNAELDLQSGDSPHWAIYQDESTKGLTIWNGVIRTSISTGGNLNAQGLCINSVCKTDWNQVSGGGTVNYTGTCDTAHKGSTGIFGNYYKICNGNYWYPISTAGNYFDGDGTNENPYRIYGEAASAITVTATSCNYYNMNSTTHNDGTPRFSGSCGGGTKACLTSGVYRITVGGKTSNVYCDMTTDGGGWTLIVGINATDKNHNTLSDFNSTNLTSVSGKGKYSDVFINSIRTAGGSEGIVRLTCGNTDYFDYRSTVWHATYSAMPNGVGWDVYTYPWGTAPHSGAGLTWGNQPGPWSHNSWGQVIIYGYSGWNGCYNGTASGQSGTTWIR